MPETGGLWCGAVPEGVSQEEPLNKMQIKGAHDRDQQVHLFSYNFPFPD